MPARMPLFSAALLLTLFHATTTALSVDPSAGIYTNGTHLPLPPHLSRHDRPLQDNYPPDDLKRFPRSLSSLAAYIYSNVTTAMLQDKNYKNSPTPVDLIGTSGRLVQLTSGGGNTERFADNVIFPAIVSAKEEVLLTTFIFDRDTPSSDALPQAILELNERARQMGRRVRVYVAIDTVGATTFSHELPQFSSLFSSVNEINGKHYHLPLAKHVPYLDYRVKNVHKRLLGALHSKMILIDGRYTVMGSKNLDGDPAFEQMFTVRGAVRSLRSDFEDLWDEHLPELTGDFAADNGMENHPGPFYPPLPDDVPILTLSRVQSPHLLDTLETNPQNIGWYSAIEAAQQDIYIQTPNFSADLAVEAVLAAVKRGVHVTIVTSYSLSDSEQRKYVHNKGNNRDTAEYMFKKLKHHPEAKERLRICWFINASRTEADPKPLKEDWSHVKFMSVDGKIAITGSGNHDAQSWYRSRENNILFDDEKTTRWFMEELLRKNRSLKHCYSS